MMQLYKLDNDHDKDKFVKDNLKFNFILNTIDGAAFSLGITFIAFNTIFPVFLKKLGGTNLLISLIPFITITGSSIPQLFAAHHAQGLERKKAFVLLVGLLQRLPWFIIAIACLVFGKSSPKILISISILMFIVVSVAGGLAGPTWFDLFSKVTPMYIRGRLMSIRAIIGQLLGVVGSFLTTGIIGEIMFPYNYSILFFIAFFFNMLSFIALALIREPSDEIKEGRSDFLLFIKNVPQVLKYNKDFRYFVVSRAFFELSMSVPAFYSVFAIKQFQLPDSYAGIFTTTTAISYVVINFLLGSLGDKKGHKLNLLIGQITCILASLLAILANNIYLFLLVFIFTAISQSIKDISVSSITVEFCKAEERATYIAISSIIMIPISVIVLAIGSIADLFGYSYIFGLTILSSGLSAVLIYFKITDPRRVRKNKLLKSCD